MKSPSLLPGHTQARLLVVLCSVCYGLAFLGISATGAVKHFGYLGFGQVTPQLNAILVVVVLCAAVGVASPIGRLSPARLTLWMIALFTTLPTIAIAPTLQRDATDVLVMVTFVGYVTASIVLRLNLVKVTGPTRLTQDAFCWLLLGLAFVFTGLTVWSYGASIRLTGLFETYDVRAEFEQVASTHGNFLTPYAMSFAYKVISPGLIAVGVLWRRWLPLCVGLGVQVIVYSVVPQKINLALTVAVLALAIALRALQPRFPSIAATLLATTVILTWVFRGAGNLWFSSSVFRTFFVPIDVALMWMAFFVASAKGNFADAIPLLHNEYSADLPRLMSTLYGSGVGAFNANLWVDGYANLGFLGVILVAFALGLALTVADDWAEGSDPRLAALLVVGPTIGLTNGSLTTVLLSGGMGLALLLIGIAPPGSAARIRKESDLDSYSGMNAQDTKGAHQR